MVVPQSKKHMDKYFMTLLYIIRRHYETLSAGFFLFKSNKKWTGVYISLPIHFNLPAALCQQFSSKI